MSIASESITEAGSGLSFINTYDSSVTDPYRTAIVAAERELESHFTNPVTINATFDLASLSDNFAAQNDYTSVSVSYSRLASALASHAASSDDHAAVAGLPYVDPSNGAGFQLPLGEAVALGVAPQSNAENISVTLNSNLGWTFGQDAVGVIEHELTEGVFGRVASLGFAGTQWAPLDLFRFTATGQRDYTGGSDGVPTYFGVNGSQITQYQFHNSIGATGANDGSDLGDWQTPRGDAFGAGGPGSAAVLSPTDLRLIDILGWNTAAYTPPADDFANSLADSSHPFGQITVGGVAYGGLQSAGDRDWFQVTLQGGSTYTIDEIGAFGGGGTLADPYLRLHDATGALVAFNDDLTSGKDPDSRITYAAPTSGTYYIEAGAYLDGYTGSYRLDVVQSAAASTNESLSGASVTGGAGNDTIIGTSDRNTLLGMAGDDSIVGSSGVNSINGNLGDDTIVGRSTVGDTIFGGQGNDRIDLTQSTAHNLVNGNRGDDIIVGGSGGDSLYGGQGNDQITGGAGADWISGDLGQNTLTGGPGADTFHAGAGLDVVTDFSVADRDRVQVDAGLTVTVTQSAADVVIDISNGGEMLLRNVQLGALGPINDWIVTH